MTAGSVPILDAAAVILLRRDHAGPRVLMGQRGAKAVFMPSKFVFPGGAVDPEDGETAPDARIDPRLSLDPLAGRAPDPAALLSCARRELAEETGLRLDPAAEAFFMFRAITPPGLPRRFDARFFLYEADAVCGDLEDFSAACDELSHLHWVGLKQARRLALPFITEVVLAEVEAMIRIAGTGPLQRPPMVPFFDNRDAQPRFVQIS